MKKNILKNQKGFTLIELLIVIVIIAIIAGVVFVGLDPLTRFKDARDATRWSDASAILSAIKISQVDSGGSYIQSIKDLDEGSIYMISANDNTSNCNDQNDVCDVDVDGATYCVNLDELVQKGYLPSVPVSRNGEGNWTEDVTGYTLIASTSGMITIQACESENTDEIKMGR